MAWETPLTWADGDIPTASQFNQQFRDNFNELALHKHDGGSGSGSSILGPLNGATFQDGTEPTGASGTLTRLFTTVGTLGWVSPSGSVFKASNSTHEHGVNFSQISTRGTFTTANATNTLAVAKVLAGTLATAATSITTMTGTFGGTGSRGFSVSAHVVVYNATAAGRVGTIRLLAQRDGTNTGSIRETQFGTNGTELSMIVLNYTATNAVAGSYAFIVQAFSSASAQDQLHVISASIDYVESRYA